LTKTIEHEGYIERFGDTSSTNCHGQVSAIYMGCTFPPVLRTES
jgi:hypothetical protein